MSTDEWATSMCTQLLIFQKSLGQATPSDLLENVLKLKFEAL